MVSFVQFMAEGEEPTFAAIKTLSPEARVLETCLGVWRAFNQGHELVRFILDRIAKNEDFPRMLDCIRFLNVWHSRAFQLMELCGDEIRVISAGTCAHDAALDFAGHITGAVTMAGITKDDDYLRRVQLPDLATMNDRLKVEKARALDRVREKIAIDSQSETWLKIGLPPDGWHKTPLCGRLKDFLKWADTSDKTLQNKNGIRWWVTEWTGRDTPFAIYFPTPQQYGDAVNRRDDPKQPKPAGAKRRKSEKTGAVARKRRAK